MLSPIAKAIETRTTKGASAATEAALPMTEAGIVLGTIEPGAPQALCAPRIVLGARDNQQGRQYDVAGDGRFLIDTELDDDVGAPIRLIQNWDGTTR